MIASLWFLASAVTADADCAWVAWQERTLFSPTTEPASEWTIIQAASSQKACAESAAAQANARAAFWRSPERTPSGSNPKFTRQIEASPSHVRVTDSTGSIDTYRYLCLPDAVDPREPKGK